MARRHEPIYDLSHSRNVVVMSMKTMERLTSAYENARVEEFDNDSKYIVMSDCHRGDGATSDEFLKNKNVYVAALDYYWKNGFTYIEAGDGDELWEQRQYKHIIKANRAVWSRIKPFHHAGRFIRLYGNHDMQLKYPEFVRKYLWTAPDPDTGELGPFLTGLEPIEALVLKHRVTGQEILVVHGHQGDFWNDQAWKFNMWSLRLFWKYLHAFGVHSPSSPVRNSYERHKVERNYVKWIRLNCVALICGHTHREKFPKGDELPYFNAGSCLYPSHITGLEITGGAITLVRWRVDANEDGFLQAARRVLAGPTPLEKLDLKRRG